MMSSLKDGDANDDTSHGFLTMGNLCCGKLDDHAKVSNGLKISVNVRIIKVRVVMVSLLMHVHVAFVYSLVYCYVVYGR